MPVSEDRPHAAAPRPDEAPLNAAVSSLAPPAAARPKTSLHEDPHRDLSYLLEEDHAPPKPNRLPFIVGGVLLAVVAAFFAMRGGGKPASPETADSTASALQSEPTPETTAPTTTSRPKLERPVPLTEPAATEPASTGPASNNAPETEQSRPPATETAPIAPVKKAAAPKAHPPSPKIVAKAAKPAPRSRKPSPSQPEEHATPASEASVGAESVAGSSDCERIPALRKAADRGDVKARTSLGLVYYSGQCVPRDLPTAYHWYALALRANPDNAQLSAQLEAIWKQMSSAERQVAIGPRR